MEQNFQYPNSSLFSDDPSFYQTLNPPQNLIGQENTASASAAAAAAANQALALGLSFQRLSLSSDQNTPGESGDRNRLFDFHVLGNYRCQERGLRISDINNDIGCLGWNPGSGFGGVNWSNGGRRLGLYDSNGMNQSMLWSSSDLNIESLASGTDHPMWNSNNNYYNRSYYDLDCYLSRNSRSNFRPSGLPLNRHNWVSGNSYHGNVVMDSRTMVNGASSDNVMDRIHILLTKHRNIVRVKNLEGTIRTIAKDSRWCNILLEKMENMDNEDKETIFLDIKHHVGDLMMDPYGTNVVKKFVAVCSEQQRSRILSFLTKKTCQLVNICSDRHGAEAVIMLLDHLISPQQRRSLSLALSYGIHQLSMTESGAKVIVYCLNNLSNEENKLLFTAMVENCYRISTERHGCRSMQTYLSLSRGQLRDGLVAKITAHARSLAADQFGNYVVQYLLNWKVPQITAGILQQLEGHHFSLCWCKYGSNVVEECLKAGAEQFEKIIFELLRNPQFPELCSHQFGNYVFQEALHCAKVYGRNDIRDFLLRIVDSKAPTMRNTYSGRKVLDKIFRARLNSRLSVA